MSNNKRKYPTQEALDFGEALEAFRKQKGLTRDQMTEKLNISSTTYYGGYERGEHLPGLKFLTDFSKAFGPLNAAMFFLGGDDLLKELKLEMEKYLSTLIITEYKPLIQGISNKFVESLKK